MPDPTTLARAHALIAAAGTMSSAARYAQLENDAPDIARAYLTGAEIIRGTADIDEHLVPRDVREIILAARAWLAQHGGERRAG